MIHYTSFTTLRILACFFLLASTSQAMPSFDHGALLPLGSMLNPKTFPIEVRGVYGGRKKRYIVEREEPACTKECRNKPICIPTLGEIVKDCKCQKCGTGVPALDGNSCEENCPQGQEKNGKGGCCPIGQVPTTKGDGCEAKKGESDRKGECPAGQILDPKHGWDPKPRELKCQIDDEKDCPKPKIPETRPEGKENDPAYKPLCGELEEDESKRPRCDPKSQFVHVSVDTQGKATEVCKQTRKYQDRKLGKPTNNEVRAKIKERFNQLKPDYDKKNQEREESLKKLKEIQAQRDKEVKERDEKIKKVDDKKKERQAKCSTPIALLLGVAVSEAMNSKRDGEHPYDWTTDYFDEEFVSSDDRLKEWPEEVDINTISDDVDTEAFLKKWDEYLDDHRKIGHSCTYVRKRSLDRRCSQRRSLDEWDNDFDSETLSVSNSSLIGRDFSAYSTEIDHLDKRNPFAALLLMISQFAGRLAVQITARAAASVGANSPRLAALIKTPERLFQIAPKGQGTKAGVKGMDNAKAMIRKDSGKWIKCLRDGVP